MKRIIKECIFGFLFAFILFGSMLFFGMRARAASVREGVHTPAFEDLQENPRREIADMRSAEEWEPEWVNPLSQYEMDLLAALVWSEAGDQRPLFEGLCWVCDVVLNRRDSSSWPSTIHDVIYQSGQFSVVSNGALARAYGNAPQICYDAIISQLQNRWNYDIIYFSQGYLANGRFAFVSDTHYFGY